MCSATRSNKHLCHWYNELDQIANIATCPLPHCNRSNHDHSRRHHNVSRRINQFCHRNNELIWPMLRKRLASSSVGNMFGGGWLAIGCRSSVIVITKVNHRTSTKIADGARQRSHPRRPERQPTKLHQLADRRRHGGHPVVAGKRQARQLVQLTDVVRNTADKVALEG